MTYQQSPVSSQSQAKKNREIVLGLLLAMVLAVAVGVALYRATPSPPSCTTSASNPATCGNGGGPSPAGPRTSTSHLRFITVSVLQESQPDGSQYMGQLMSYDFSDACSGGFPPNLATVSIQITCQDKNTNWKIYYVLQAFGNPGPLAGYWKYCDGAIDFSSGQNQLVNITLPDDASNCAIDYSKTPI